MPVERVERDGKIGYRWGKRGKVYFGKDARKRALEQGQAIEASKKAAKEKRK